MPFSFYSARKTELKCVLNVHVCLFVCPLPVPLQSFIVKPVEEVRLRADSSHVRVDAEKLQQGAGSSFLHADYNRLRKPFGPESVGHGDAVALGALLCAVRHVLRRVHLFRVRGG